MNHKTRSLNKHSQGEHVSGTVITREASPEQRECVCVPETCKKGRKNRGKLLNHLLKNKVISAMSRLASDRCHKKLLNEACHKGF